MEQVLLQHNVKSMILKLYVKAKINNGHSIQLIKLLFHNSMANGSTDDIHIRISIRVFFF